VHELDSVDFGREAHLDLGHAGPLTVRLPVEDHPGRRLPDEHGPQSPAPVLQALVDPAAEATSKTTATRLWPSEWVRARATSRRFRR
jgi:hypothetical protein